MFNVLKNLSDKVELKKVLHIGAHTGSEVSTYEKLGISYVTWFEANPFLIKDLEKNLNNFKSINHIIENYAVTSSTKKVSFNLIYNNSLTNTGCSSLYELKHHLTQYPDITKVETIEVNGINLDDYFNNKIFDFDIINMDIQGVEYEVLTTNKILFEKRPKVFIIETSTDEMYEGQKLKYEMNNLFNEMGYTHHYHYPHAHNWGDSVYVDKNLEL